MDGCLFTRLSLGPYLSRLRVLSADFGLIFNSAELLRHEVTAGDWGWTGVDWDWIGIWGSLRAGESTRGCGVQQGVHSRGVCPLRSS